MGRLLQPALAAAMVAAVLAGCGIGPGSGSEGTATLTVTRDYGSQTMIAATVTDPDGSETVLRMLDREVELETRYGGGFVQAIDGVSGGVEDGRRFDWFFYVNGIESPVGSAEREVAGGDRVWWDHHDWSDVMRVPAVVGSWPEPFLQASAEEPVPVLVECAGARVPCRAVLDRLDDAGVDARIGAPGDGRRRDLPRLIVGPWTRVEDDPAAAQIEAGPSASGVFAAFDAARGGSTLVAMDEHGEEAARLGAGAGMVAAVREGERPVTWLVSGVDAAGVRAASRALDSETLSGRFAVAVGAGSDRSLALPAVEEGI